MPTAARHRAASIGGHNEYFRMIRGTWGRCRQVVNPLWTRPEDPASLVPASREHQPLRARPVDVAPAVYPASPGAGRDPGKDQAELASG